MLIFLTTLLASLASIFRSRASLGLENLALRHQIGVQSSPKIASRSHSEFGSPDSTRVHKPIDLCGSFGRIPSTLGLLRISGRHNRREILDCLSYIMVYI